VLIIDDARIAPLALSRHQEARPDAHRGWGTHLWPQPLPVAWISSTGPTTASAAKGGHWQRRTPEVSLQAAGCDGGGESRAEEPVVDFVE
jgi:hypothetical protein